ncbi:MAG: FtsB family cell division protein [Patescibacteria group bacterium]
MRKNLLTYFLLFLGLVFLISLVRNISRVLEARKRIGRAESRVEKLKEENEEIKRKLAEVKGEEFIEKQLRDRLGLAKEGEIVVVLPDEEILRKIAPPVPEEEDTLPDPTWKKWLKLFY